MLCEVPLTKEQQTFATAHHSLVYKFLNENRLPEDEFYDVVIFGYLKAVRDYFSDLTAQQFTFSTIANRRMKFCLFDYFRTQERRKRNMEILSIHVGLYPDGAPLEDTIPAHDPIMQQLEMDLLLHELAGRVSKQQMDIVHLKQGGYGIREIAAPRRFLCGALKSCWLKSMMCCWTFAMDEPITDTKYSYIHIFKRLEVKPNEERKETDRFEWFSAASTVCWTGCDSARRRKHLPYFACGGDSGGVGGLRPF